MSDKAPVQSLLFTDLYQLTMAASYFESGKFNESAVFEYFFRKCPFEGEYAICGGFDQLRELLENANFSPEDIHYLRELPQMKSAPKKFFEAISNFSLNDIEVQGVREGEIVFPRAPILQVRGPLWKLQLLESGILNSLNFATLCATYARRIRQVAKTHQLAEFGLRRAQGPNGALTATRSSYLGGFDSTSFVEAGMLFNIPVVGTMAHSFVQSYSKLDDNSLNWKSKSIKEEVLRIIEEDSHDCNEGELAAFLSYARCFPDSCLLLVDTYNCLKSGVPNAIRTFKVLRERGHKPLGIRLDSGDLSYISIEARRMLDEAGFREAKIFASNELDENTIASLIAQNAQITGWGVGTRLVTCSEQPALGGVYKLVELNGLGRIKLSEQTDKMTLPCAKSVFRLYGENDTALLDLLCQETEGEPQAGTEVLALHPFDNFKQARVIPKKVRKLLQPLFFNGRWLSQHCLEDNRSFSLERMAEVRTDILRRENPTPYKVSLSQKLKDEFDRLFREETSPQALR